MNATPRSTHNIRPSASAQTQAQEDAVLVRRFVHGDETAFNEILSRHRLRIFTVVKGLLRDQGDAEEITQDTFLRAYHNLSRFRGESSLATWLHRIATNLAKNRYWYFFRRRRHATLSLDVGIGEDGDNALSDLFASSEPTPAQDSCRHEFASLIEECTALLDPHHRQILHLRNVQNLAYEEIAEQLNINTGTVKSRLARARQRLQRRMTESCPEFAPDAQIESWFEPSRLPPAIIRALG